MPNEYTPEWLTEATIEPIPNEYTEELRIDTIEPMPNEYAADTVGAIIERMRTEGLRRQYIQKYRIRRPIEIHPHAINICLTDVLNEYFPNIIKTKEVKDTINNIEKTICRIAKEKYEKEMYEYEKAKSSDDIRQKEGRKKHSRPSYIGIDEIFTPLQ